MQYDIIHYAQHRYTTKAYDPNRTISEDKVEKIKTLLRYSPSSVNSQPWYFILASTAEGKARVAKSTKGLFHFNSKAILDASHVVVFCSKLEADEAHMLKVLTQEDKDQRFALGEEYKEKTHIVRNLFANYHKHDLKDVQHWMDKQVYLNLGQFLLGVAALGIDATPMEGIDTRILDEEFGLREQGFNSLIVVPLGYRQSEKDFNAKLPKSRLPFSDTLLEV